MAEAYQTAYSGGWYYFIVDGAGDDSEAEATARRQFTRIYPAKNVTDFTAVVRSGAYAGQHNVTLRLA